MKAAELSKNIRVLLTGSSFIFFWGGGAMLSWVIFPLIDASPLPKLDKRRLYQEWVKWGFNVFHGYMRVLGLTDYHPKKVEIDLPEGPFVMISNHPTLVDVTAIMSVVGQLSVVVKTDYWRPEVRRLLARCNHINGGNTEDALTAGAVAVQALERLAEGQPVLIFPEGTRSPEHGIRTFQRGAFEIARRAKVPVVPLFITAEPAWLMKHQRWFHVPPKMNSMRLELLEEGPFDPLEGSSSEHAASYEKRYRDRLDDWLQKRRGSGKVRD
jgi:1-acyl-sn-glycerol-3-phosphate acyltransferase